MAIRKVLTYPNAALRAPARLISDEEISDRSSLLSVLSDVEETLATLDNAAALACNQVGINLRAFVVVPKYALHTGVWFLNPQIEPGTWPRSKANEGCLSFPDISLSVERATTATMVYTALDGLQYRMVGVDFVARMWQHEVDHLDGKLFIDDVAAGSRDPAGFKHRIAMKILKKGNGNVR